MACQENTLGKFFTVRERWVGGFERVSQKIYARKKFFKSFTVFLEKIKVSLLGRGKKLQHLKVKMRRKKLCFTFLVMSLNALEF